MYSSTFTARMMDELVPVMKRPASQPKDRGHLGNVRPGTALPLSHLHSAYYLNGKRRPINHIMIISKTFKHLCSQPRLSYDQYLHEIGVCVRTCGGGKYLLVL